MVAIGTSLFWWFSNIPNQYYQSKINNTTVYTSESVAYLWQTLPDAFWLVPHIQAVEHCSKVISYKKWKKEKSLSQAHDKMSIYFHVYQEKWYYICFLFTCITPTSWFLNQTRQIIHFALTWIITKYLCDWSWASQWLTLRNIVWTKLMGFDVPLGKWIWGYYCPKRIWQSKVMLT